MWIAIQLALSFFVASTISDNALIVMLLGTLFTLNVTRGLYVANRTLNQLNRTLHPAIMRTLTIDPMRPMLENINQLALRDVGALREALIEQTSATAAQQERNRLARELHDSIKQQLFSINISAAAVAARLDKDLAGAKAALSDVRLSVKAAMAEMNALLQQLSPAPLEKVGLQQAIRDQCEALGYRTGVDVQVVLEPLPADANLQPGTQDAIFRIVQEALSNVARHARASNVVVRLKTIGQRVELNIEDDGLGFSGSLSGMGLTNMRERVLALDGRISVKSRPGDGTQIRASIPFNDDLQEDIVTDHTLNRVFLSGLIGGLLLTATLVIPLYFVLPADYVSGWPDINPLLSFISSGAALVVLFVTGMAGARFGRSHSISLKLLFGAIAGLVAAMIGFMAIGASAAGVIGSRSIFDYGLQPAQDEEHMMIILYESITEILFLGNIGFWVALIVGTGISALGGLMSPRHDTGPDLGMLRRARSLLLTVAVIVSGVTAVTTFFIFTTLSNAIWDQEEFAHLAEQDLAGLAALAPVLTSILIYVGLIILVFLFQRRDLRTGHNTNALMDGIDFARLALVAAIFFVPSAEAPSFAVFVAFWGPGILLLMGARQAIQPGDIDTPHYRIQPVVMVGGYVAMFAIAGLLRGLEAIFLGVCFTIGVGVGVWIAQRKQEYRIATAVLIAAATVCAIMAWYLYAAGVLLGLAGLIVGELVRKVMTIFENKQYTAHDDNAWQTHAGSVVASITVIALAILVPIVSAMPLVIIVISAIAPLSSYDSEFVEPARSLSELVDSLYFAQGQAVLITFAISIGIVGIITLIAYGIRRWQQRRQLVEATAV